MHHNDMTARKRVMIVSHGRQVGLGLADRMASEGYEVTLAQHTDEAIEQLSGLQPDGIVLDHHLPIASGLEMLRLIRLRCPQVPVFTIRQSTNQHDPEHSLIGGGAVCLMPFQLPLMRILIDTHVGVVRT